MSRLPLVVWVLVATLCVGCLVPPPPGSRARAGSDQLAPDPPIPPRRPDGRLPPLAVPLGYELKLQVDPWSTRFSGEVAIRIDVAAPTRYVVLNGHDLSIRSVTASVGSTQVEGTAIPRLAFSSQDYEELVLAFARDLPSGAATLRLTYDAPFGEMHRGLFRTDVSGQGYAFTQFEPSGARCAFPSFDDPAFKTPFEVSLVIPRRMRAFSNTPETLRAETSEGILFRFAPTPPLPAYLVAFVVGDFEVNEGPASPVPIRLLRTKGKSGLASLPLAVTRDLLKVLAEYFDYPYPFGKVDLVAAPEFFWGAMENPGLIVFKDEILLREQNDVSVVDRRALIRTLAHELAHQWAGNLVTMRWWDDAWLNEGLATFVEGRAVDAWQPSFGARLERQVWARETMEGEPAVPWKRTRPPVVTVEEADDAVRNAGVTGAAVLDMLEAWVGEEALRKGVRQYMRTHAWKSATTADLLAELESASGKQLAPLASTFLDQEGFPELSVTPHCEGRQLVSLAVRQDAGAPRSGEGAAHRLWTIPFCAGAGTGRNLGKTCREISTETASVPFAGRTTHCPLFVDANPGLAGYYRYALAPDQLELAIPEIGRLGLSEKIEILSSAWGMMERKRLKPDVILRLLPAFDGERSHLILDLEASILQRLSDLITDDETERAFQRYVSARLARYNAWLGLASPGGQEDDDRVLARAILLWQGGRLAGDRACLDAADRATGPWFENPDEVIDPDVKSTAMGLSAMRLDAERFDKLEVRIARSKPGHDRSMALWALGNVQDPILVRRALELTLRLDLTPNEVYSVMSTVAARKKTRRLLIDWMTSQWERVRERRHGDPGWPLRKLIRFACDEEEEKALMERLQPEHGYGGWFEEQRQEAVRCRELKAYGGDALSKYLANPGLKKAK